MDGLFYVLKFIYAFVHWEEQATTAQTAAPVSGAAKSSASSASTNAAAGPASQSTPTPEQHK